MAWDSSQICPLRDITGMQGSQKYTKVGAVDRYDIISYDIKLYNIV